MSLGSLGYAIHGAPGVWMKSTRSLAAASRLPRFSHQRWNLSHAVPEAYIFGPQVRLNLGHTHEAPDKQGEPFGRWGRGGEVRA